MRAVVVLFVVGLCARAAAQCEYSKVFPLDGGAGDQYGTSVAISNDYAIAGSIFHDGIGSNSGAAYILKRQPSGEWREHQKLFASDEALDDRYGHSVAIDWRTALVGARYNDDAGYGSGSVYVYTRVGTQWNETAYLTASDESISALFGHAVDVSGPLGVVGAYGESTNGFQAGAVYVYDAANHWAEEAKLTSDEIAQEHRFGRDVAVFSDAQGSVVLVGAIGVNQDDVQTGAAYIFEREGSSWSQEARLLPADGGHIDLFGSQVDIHGDVAVVGAQLHDGNGTDSGAVYVFERQPDDSWRQSAKLVGSDTVGGSFFGSSVAVEEDMIIVGAWPHAGFGKVYVFRDFGEGWVETAGFTAGDAVSGDAFGFVGLSGDVAIVGARGVSNSNGDNTGAAYLLGNLDAFRSYGEACPGSGGFVPEFTLSGCAAPGGEITLSLDKGPGGAAGIIAVGPVVAPIPFPLNGCSLLVDPWLTTLGPFALQGQGPGEGALDLSVPIPVGTPEGSVGLQWYVLDPAVPGWWTISNGVELTIETP